MEKQKLTNFISKNQEMGLKYLLGLEEDDSNWFESKQNSDDSVVWKIIIFDKYCQDILSTLFKVGNLRDENITLHLNIFDKREKLNGVKAIYFVRPIQENIDQIAKDFENNLYDNIYFKFVYPVEQSLLENLAIRIGKTQKVYKIKQVQQHALSFISLNQDLFTFNFDHLYRQLSTFSSKKDSVDISIIDKIAMNLYCICRTMNCIPTIIYRTDIKIHKKICESLEKIFNEQYINTQEFKNSEGNFSRYTLLMHDRSADLGTVLMHPWHYGALVHDILKINNNKVEMNNEATENKQVVYDLDPQTDKYWASKINTPFPDVLEETPKEVERWTQEYNNMGFRNKNQSQEEQHSNISKALDEVTNMQERKRKLDIHTNIATHITKQLSERELDKFFEIGSALIQNGFLSKSETNQMVELIQGSSAHELDKLRLLILYAIYDQDQKMLPELIQKSGIKKEKNLKILEFVKKLNTSAKTTDSKTAMLFSLARNMAKKVNLGKELSPYIIQIIKQLLTDQAFIQQTGTINVENHSQYQILKQGDQNGQNSRPLRQNTNDLLQNIIVFCVEGGGYAEYQALNEFAKKNNKNIIYGGSTIYNAQDLLEELAETIQ